jgi:uncharacterized protein (DUF2062 family)
MFKRRTKRTFGARLVSFIWPSMGWRRTGVFYAIRIKRLPGTPYSIACGFALGAAVSFTPFIGFHFILAAVFAYLLRANLIAAALGTVVGNPWTFPFIWAGIYWLGGKILGYEKGVELPEKLSMEYIFQEPVNVLLPMVAGGVPIAVLVWWVIYLPVHRIVANYQSLRRQKRLQRREVLARERAMNGAQNIDAAQPGEGQARLHIEIDRAGDVAPEGGVGEEPGQRDSVRNYGRTVEEES